MEKRHRDRISQASQPRAGWSRIVTHIGQALLLAAAYFGAAKLSLLLAIPPGYATAVWPPSGIALAAALLAGPRIWPGIWLGAALTNLTVQGLPLVAALIATGNTLEALAAAALAHRYVGTQGQFERGEDVIKFVAASALCATIAAAIGVLSLAITGTIPWSDIAVHAWTWWEGDASGMIIVTPLIVSWIASPLPKWSFSKAIEAVALASAVALAALLIFGAVPSASASLPMAFILLPFIIWAAIRFGQREVTAVIAMACAIAIWHAVQGHGPFGMESPNASLLFLLAYTSTLVMTGLVLSVVIRERQRAITALRRGNEELEQRIEERTLELAVSNQTLRAELAEHSRQEEILRQSEERFRLLVDGVKDYAIFMLDSEGKVESWNTGAENIYGYAATEMVGAHFSRLYTPEDLARNWPEHELAVARAEGRFEDEGLRVRKDGSTYWASVIIAALYDSERRVRGFAKVTRDLTTRQRMEALQESERQMNEFLAMLGHELRNPLASIVNALGLMRSKSGQEEADFRDVIERQTTHLARIVDDLLDVSRITRGKIALKSEILDMNQLVARTVESCRPMIDARKHAVELQLAGAELPVDGDPTRLSQVVLNLISNAVKYTPVGGRIRIAMSHEDGEAVLRVRDTGIGIPPALLSNVFDLFVQGDRSLDRTEGGLGIGLTLVKRLTEMHGGSVAASSGGVGKGSEFVVRLPLALERRAAQVLHSEDAAGPPPTRRLLVVDDNPDFLATLAALLETMGHEVRTAHNGPDAILAATAQPPDAVFLDIGLPGMSGYEVARRLRDSPGLAEVTLIAFTGYGQEDDRRRVREAGFDYHLVKPAGAAELMKIIDALPMRSQGNLCPSQTTS